MMQKSKTQRTKTLVDTGNILSSIDEQVRIDSLRDKVNGLDESFDKLKTNIDSFNDKFEGLLLRERERTDDKHAELSERLAQLQVDVATIDERTKTLVEQQQNRWVNTVLRLLESKGVRSVLLVVAGYIAHEAGPTIVGALVKLMGE